MSFETLMGDEALALGAMHAGMRAAFAYPGTPSTEIMEYYQASAESGGAPGLVAQWCSNEKTAYESALGASFAGCRASVSMKHVGLNVAMDPFVNSALLRVKGGLVVMVADDPGMHSSQDEQDSRVLAEFARVPCLEPADCQEAYDMAREAFDLSERLQCPVMLRVVTRLAHSRAVVRTAPPRGPNPVEKTGDRWGWTLMPQQARVLWKETLAGYEEARAGSEAAAAFEPGTGDVGIVTAGLAREYYRANLPELAAAPHVHVGRYPMPRAALRELASRVKRIVVLEEGYPFIERELRGILPGAVAIAGKETGEVPLTGELTPDNVRPALGLAPRASLAPETLPRRPPQLCKGCPHADTFAYLKEAVAAYPVSSVNADIGCYTLGAMQPFACIESVVDMGASIGMARGASEAGLRPAVAVIGDSTFYHSGIPNLVDAVSHGSDITVLIVDNSTTGMTGAQPTILPSERLAAIVLALGVEPGHVVTLEAHPRCHDANVAALRRELDYRGPSVVISSRPCLEALKNRRKA